MSINIRKAKIEDLNDVVILSYKSAIYHKKLNAYYDISEDAKEILTKSLKENIYSSDSCILVAEENNKIIGYLLAFKIDRLEMFEIKKAGSIVDIFIDENNRRMGLGDKLVDEIFKWFKESDVHFIEITVEVSNEKAINFWNRKGFKDVAIEKYLVI